MTGPEPKPWIMAIAPYVPGRSTTDDGRKVAKLSSNENPLGTSPKAREAFVSAAGNLERYPDASGSELRDVLAAKHGLDPARIIYGNGSDEVLHLAAGAFAGPGDEVIFVHYGFAVYEIAARRVGAVPVDRARQRLCDRCRCDPGVRHRSRRGSSISPTPTTRPAPMPAARKSRGSTPGLRSDILLVLDHAYAEYIEGDAEDGGMALAETASNVLVTRTFSKMYGLAAERIGWGYASAEIIAAMHRIRLPFSITIAGTAAAVAALGDEDFVAHTRAHNAEWRAWFSAEIAKLGNAGLRAVPSQANFVLVLFEGTLTAEAAYKGRWTPATSSAGCPVRACRTACASPSAPRTRRRASPRRCARWSRRPADAAVRARLDHRIGPDRLVDRARGQGAYAERARHRA